MKNGINVLSLFDGMSCGMIVLDKLGVKVDNYFSSEINKKSIQVSKDNYDNIIYIGDITKVTYLNGYLYTENGVYRVGKIHLVIGGSPCQGFSRAGGGLNFNDPRSKLFFEYVRLLKEINPEYFFLENVVMKKEWQDIITSHLGVNPLKINSNLLLPHSRPRLYWSNLPIPSIQQKEYLLKDYLDQEYDKKLLISNKLFNQIVLEKKSDHLIIKNATKQGFIKGYPGNNVNVSFPNSKTRRGRVKPNYIGCLTTTLFEGIITDDLNIRLLSRHECEGMQGVPRGYGDSVSDLEIQEMLGNGWTIEIIMCFFRPLRSILKLK